MHVVLYICKRESTIADIRFKHYLNLSSVYVRVVLFQVISSSTCVYSRSAMCRGWYIQYSPS